MRKGNMGVGVVEMGKGRMGVGVGEMGKGNIGWVWGWERDCGDWEHGDRGGEPVTCQLSTKTSHTLEHSQCIPYRSSHAILQD